MPIPPFRVAEFHHYEPIAPFWVAEFHHLQYIMNNAHKLPKKIQETLYHRAQVFLNEEFHPVITEFLVQNLDLNNHTTTVIMSSQIAGFYRLRYIMNNAHKLPEKTKESFYYGVEQFNGEFEPDIVKFLVQDLETWKSTHLRSSKLLCTVCILVMM